MQAKVQLMLVFVAMERLQLDESGTMSKLVEDLEAVSKPATRGADEYQSAL